MATVNELILRRAEAGDPISANQWNEIIRLLKRTVTGPNVIETSTGWHIRGNPPGEGGLLTIPVTNKSGETAPEGAWVEVYDWDDTSQTYWFRKPTADNLETAYILTAEIANGGTGTAWDKGVTVGAYFDSNPSNGDTVGSVNGEWYGAASDEGTHILIGDDYTGP